jgi:aspartate/methionine/tyrosine aminotransferase
MTVPPRSTLARAQIEQIPTSHIRLVANAGMGLPDVLPFWFGESDQPAHALVREAAAAALGRGETLYSHNLGLPELRDAYASYVNSLHTCQLTPERVVITSAGVSALMVAAQALVNPGDEVVVVEPVWPNLPALPRILGGQLKTVALAVLDGRWQLDIDALLNAITSATKMVMVNSPNNPSGWVMPRAQQEKLLAHCRVTGTWIVSDEVYHRLDFASARGIAPSLLDIAEPHDRVVVVHSFSKSFWMTGFRLGALIVPPDLLTGIGKLMEFNTSCAPVFVQRAGIVAIENADMLVGAVRAQLDAARPVLLRALGTIAGATVPVPDGAMYVFFRVPGSAHSLDVATRLVTEAGLGLAPGSAFGASGEGYLRWCYAGAPERMELGVSRLKEWLNHG